MRDDKDSQSIDERSAENVRTEGSNGESVNPRKRMEELVRTTYSDHEGNFIRSILGMVERGTMPANAGAKMIVNDLISFLFTDYPSLERKSGT